MEENEAHNDCVNTAEERMKRDQPFLDKLESKGFPFMKQIKGVMNRRITKSMLKCEALKTELERNNAPDINSEGKNSMPLEKEVE